MRREPGRIGPSYVGFLVGGQVALAVEARLVRGVARARGLIPVPFVKGFVTGVLAREGRLVPVLDMSLIPSLWSEPPPSGGDQVIVVGGGEIEAGLLARGAETFLGGESPSGSDGGQEGEPGGVSGAILSGARHARGRTYGLLRVEAVLAAAGIPDA